jgi:hypothetical protein
LRPLIRVAATETANEHGLGAGRCRIGPLDPGTADRAVRMIPFQVNSHQSLNFRIRPPPKLAPTRIVGASKLLAFPAKQALRLEVVVAASQFVQPQLQGSVINRTGGGAASPKLLDDLMSLFVRPGHLSSSGYCCPTLSDSYGYELPFDGKQPRPVQTNQRRFLPGESSRSAGRNTRLSSHRRQKKRR